MYYLQDEINFLLKPCEVPIIIEEINDDLKSNNDWLNHVNIKVKISANSVNTMDGSNKSIHEYVKETKEQNIHFKNSLEYYKQQLIIISN